MPHLTPSIPEPAAGPSYLVMRAERALAALQRHATPATIRAAKLALAALDRHHTAHLRAVRDRAKRRHRRRPPAEWNGFAS